ncbi:MAG: sensor histidine kinase [Thermoguttaceae bacterium]
MNPNMQDTSGYAPAASGDPLLPGDDADLQTVLAAWHAATLRLERTHMTLQEEVRRLTDELEAKNRELARKNRLADLGQMAAHVAHEVRNTLVPVSLYLSLLRRRLGGDDRSLDVLGKIESGFQALDVTVNDLLHFTSDRDPRRVRFPVAGLFDEICDSLRPQLAAQAISVSTKVGPGLTALADREMIRRALLNLVFNAVDAMPDGGRLELAALSCRENLTLVVTDSGPGLGDEILGRLFEPFVTTKPSGTGLGLTIVERIAEVHGGTIGADNAPGQGARFSLRIPQPAGEVTS